MNSFLVVANEVSSIVDVGTEDQGGNSSELDEDVDGGAGGILERISDGVTDDGSDLKFSSFSPLGLNFL